MICYDPFWNTLNKKGMSTYDLIYKQGFSSNTVHRLKHNLAITTKTLNDLCFVLCCSVEDIIVYRIDEEDNKRK
ncbi:MAG: helix-turn-helix transcriptional regulator [Lachnospiraceae bacterium]|nr:helix-turn-helix transcriptional regulator [Lachnospiraceae bacterium]